MFALLLSLLSACAPGDACEGLISLENGDAQILTEAWVDPGFGVGREAVRFFALARAGSAEAEVPVGSCAALIVPAGTWSVGAGVVGTRLCTRTETEEVTVGPGETVNVRVELYAESCSTDTAVLE